MKDWIKKNKDALIISGLTVTGTALVAGITYAITSNVYMNLNNINAMQMASIASDAGALDKIIAHQDKLKSIIQQ
jgi:hypothetical protein